MTRSKHQVSSLRCNLSGTAVTIQFNGNISLGGSQSYTEIGGGSTYNGLEVVANTTLTGSSITLVGDLGKRNSNGNTLALDTSATNGPINLNISVGRSGIWFNLNAFTANSGTGTITWSGAYASLGNQGTPITLTGGIDFLSNFLSTSAQTMTLNAMAPSTVSGTFSGPLSLVVGGTSTLAISSSNTYTGSTTVNAGATMQLGDGVSHNGSVAGNITDNGNLAFANPTAQTYAGVVSGSGGVTVSGPGAITLVGTNTYSGATRVNAGTLVISGSLANSQVNVAGGTLAGTGLITKNVVVGTGSGAPTSSIIAPSASGGLAAQSILNIGGNLTMNSDAAFNFALNSTTQTNDALVIGGVLTLNNGVTLSGTDIVSTFFNGNGTSFILVGASGGIPAPLRMPPKARISPSARIRIPLITRTRAAQFQRRRDRGTSQIPRGKYHSHFIRRKGSWSGGLHIGDGSIGSSDSGEDGGGDILRCPDFDPVVSGSGSRRSRFQLDGAGCNGRGSTVCRMARVYAGRVTPFFLQAGGGDIARPSGSHEIQRIPLAPY